MVNRHPLEAMSSPGGARAVARCDRLGSGIFSDGEGLLFRPWLGKGYEASIGIISEWMADAGMSVRRDAATNLIGRYEGLTSDAPVLLIGSHIDSVRDGGNYDGMLGVLLGIEVVHHFYDQGVRFPFAIEVIGFGDEEGSRFPQTMITTRAMAGGLDVSGLAGLSDRDGVILETALAEAGFPISGFVGARREASDVLGYIEAHIEQGPVLEAENLAVGVVTAIAAQLRYEVRLSGQAGHAGTMAMSLRRDALAAAAEIMIGIEHIAGAGPEGLVATVGLLQVWPGVVNVVPGDVVFSMDIRAGTNAVRDMAAAQIMTVIEDVSARRRIGSEIILRQDLPAVPCDPSLTDVMAQAVENVTGEKARCLVSGAGHDAMIMAQLVPVSMLFIRCREGISHHPAESVRIDDVETSFSVLKEFIQLREGVF